MMTIALSVTIHLLLIANAALLAAASIAIMRFHNQCRRFEQFWTSPTGTKLADTTYANPLEGHGKKLADTTYVTAPKTPPPSPRLERRVSELQDVVWRLARKDCQAQLPIDSALPIENAVRMAKHGASTQELIRGCGLNIGEAQLLRKLHGKDRATTNKP